MDSSIQADELRLLLAMIRPDAADEVRHGLVSAGLNRITVLRCADQGDGTADADLFRGARVEPSLTPRVQVQVQVGATRLREAARIIHAVEPTSRLWALPLLSVDV